MIFYRSLKKKRLHYNRDNEILNMNVSFSLITRCFDRSVLEYPKLVILLLLMIVSFLGYQSVNFKLDASAETLLLEDDKDLHYSRIINSRYGQQDYLLITYAPKGDLFSDKALADLKRLRDELRKLDRIYSVVSILDVPLLESPPIPIKELASNVRTLESPDVDKTLARIEFRNSPIYQNLLISPDLKTTAVQVNFPVDKKYSVLLAQRNHYRETQKTRALTGDESMAYEEIKTRFQEYRNRVKKERHQDLIIIRGIIDQFRKDADLFLGGVSMITDDLISFIKSDLKNFGVGILIFLSITLSIIFRRIHWVILPMLCCAFSAICMIGLLGLFGWEVTVISSNFISLQLIITMAITIHLIIRYRELKQSGPDTGQRELVLNTVRLMATPCLYTGLTTIVGFGSLVLCNILPVITFGLMMIAGIVVSLLVTFLFFPASLMVLGKMTPHPVKKERFPLTSLLARFTELHGQMILVVACTLFAVCAVGISRLDVENSFIDYFKKSTEIYRGMKVIDQNLGGTTPVDVIIRFEELKTPSATPGSDTDSAGDGDFSDFEEFDEVETSEKYWFTSHRMAQVKKVHDYLEGLPETGKVLSLGTMMDLAEKFNNGEPLDNFKLALLFSELPDRFKDMVLKPYVSIENNEVRFSIRVRDSEKTLKRDRFLKKIRHDLTYKLGIKKEHVHLAGMLVLYNNMLQSLFSSQILTLGVVVIVLMAMFLALFRSVKISLIAIFPNLFSIGIVLGVMGWMNIPLDMMTITIAAISIGIAVDNTIHYIYRFRREFQIDRKYVKALHRCHGSIGYAMYYTSLTIITGFSILALSNFIPSIYFGLLTGLAMLIALFAALTLLPELIVLIKPFGPESCDS